MANPKNTDFELRLAAVELALELLHEVGINVFAIDKEIELARGEQGQRGEATQQQGEPSFHKAHIG